jgi:hypothetical protein
MLKTIVESSITCCCSSSSNSNIDMLKFVWSSIASSTHSCSHQFVVVVVLILIFQKKKILSQVRADYRCNYMYSDATCITKIIFTWIIILVFVILRYFGDFGFFFFLNFPSKSTVIKVIYTSKEIWLSCKRKDIKV